MDLPQSKLGTQDYWDDFYKREIKNFEENPEDTGECWFDDSGAEDRMVQYIEEEYPEGMGKVLDLGTGNGHLLFAIREAGVTGQFLGIDYSPTSVSFATKIASTSENLADILFKHVDFMSGTNWTSDVFDVVLDKGTLDAIALSSIPDAPRKYVANVVPLIASQGGRLIITSCNFTRDELLQLFTATDLSLVDEITYPSFQFGGQSGSSVVTLIFGKSP